MMSVINKILFLVAVLFVSQSVHSLYKLFSPIECEKNCIEYSLKSKPDLQLLFYTFPSIRKPQSQAKLVDNVKHFDYNQPFRRTYNLTVPLQTQKNGTLYLAVFLLPNNHPVKNVVELLSTRDVVYVMINMTDYRPAMSTFQLLTAGEQEQTEKKVFSHFKEEITFRILTGVDSFPRDSIPVELFSLIDVSSKNTLLPIMIYDSLSDRMSNYKNTTNRLHQEITINYAPINSGKLRLNVLIDAQFAAIRTLGFSQKELDEVKSMFMGTNVYLLMATVVISAIHIALDILAFKNDIVFWKNRKTMVGLSLRAVIWRAVSQVIIFLYLLDEEVSLIILVPSGIATLIEFWKLHEVVPVDWRRLRLKKVTLSKEELSTRSFDEEGMRYLSYVLYPLCMLAPVYSLLYLEYKSWYSWVIHSLVNCVYAFGFLFMLPQLFINYKLKSVAHLPWRAFMYKAFNTFIDDFFAFIVTIPTAHRLACFRDDIVFIIYLYQRWLYPVDSTRVDTPEHAKED